jgi:hypothetical protein
MKPKNPLFHTTLQSSRTSFTNSKFTSSIIAMEHVLYRPSFVVYCHGRGTSFLYSLFFVYGHHYLGTITDSGILCRLRTYGTTLSCFSRIQNSLPCVLPVYTTTTSDFKPCDEMSCWHQFVDEGVSCTVSSLRCIHS